MFGAKLDNLKDLYLDELKDMYDAEHQILDVLPKMAEKASARELADAFREHLEKTRRHVERLERVFDKLGEPPERKTCKGVKGLISEGEEFVKARGDADTIDASLISSAQRVEHYEMAVYGALRSYARQLGHEDQAELLQQTLNEEGEADHQLTALAESRINAGAMVGAG